MKDTLEVAGLNTYYGESQILRNVHMKVKTGSITTIMGRNGVGKSTLLKAITGLLKCKSGSIRLNDYEISHILSEDRARRGIAYVPQGREIFPKLTVFENLQLGLQARRDFVKKVPEEEIYHLFPVLGKMKKRMGGNLSGGQQQQLALARALVGKPDLLLLDEPTEGIQPSIIDDIEDVLKKLKSMGSYTILLVEQSLEFAREVTDYFFLLERGTVVLEGKAEDLSDDHIKNYLAF